jgi:lipopolysaccharide/colanic/teichoic acid biosynthesis glycosyltransferase
MSWTMYGATADTVCLVRPSVTGLWQTSGRSETTYAERIAADIEYVQALEPARRCPIPLKTVGAVLLSRGQTK